MSFVLQVIRFVKTLRPDHLDMVMNDELRDFLAIMCIWFSVSPNNYTSTNVLSLNKATFFVWIVRHGQRPKYSWIY